MIDKRIRVYWELDNRWYWGEVQDYNEKTGEHLIKYPDCGQGADTEWLKIDQTPDQQQQHVPSSNTQVDSAEGGGCEVSDTYAAVADFIAAAGDGSQHSFSNLPAATASTSSIMTPSKTASLCASRKPSTFPAPQESVSVTKQVAPSLQMSMTLPVPLPAQSFHNFYSVAAAAGAFPLPGTNPFHLSPMHNMSLHAHTSPIPHSVHGSKAAELVAAMSDPHSVSKVGVASGRLKTGPKIWTSAEDRELIQIVKSQGDPIKWSKVAEVMLDRTGKQCRERYVNHLNPNLKNSDWSPHEDATIFYLYTTKGSQWAKMSKVIPGRTDNGIKNRFHNLKRQLERDDMQRKKNTKLDECKPFLRSERIEPTISALKLAEEHCQSSSHHQNIKLWDMAAGLPILAVNTVKNRGDLNTKSAIKFDKFRKAKKEGEQCTRCGLFAPSVQCGTQICDKSGWCLSCSMIPPSICGDMLRSCLNLRKEIECDVLADVINQFKDQ